MSSLPRSSAARVTSIVLSSQQSGGQTALASFAGKTVTIAVGFGTGGGYDIYARLVATHLGNHLSGKPNVVVQNVPGAASVKAAMLVYNKAPKDGTTLGLFLSAHDRYGPKTRCEST